MSDGVGPVLVIGATGTIGRLVIQRLRDLGDAPRALTRDVQRARRVLGDDVELTAGDLTDSASLASALDGVRAVVLTHGAPYGSGDYEAIDYGAVPTVLATLDGREVRVALMSSIGVTGTGGSSRDLLDWKRRGERVLRASGLPCTIVRPGWFNGGSGHEQRIELRQGDQVDYGPVRREHVAETLVQALHTPAAIAKTVEVFSTDGPPAEDWGAAFAATAADQTGSLDGAKDRPGPPVDREPARVRSDITRWATR